MEHGAQIAVYMGLGCGRMVCGVLLALKEKEIKGGFTAFSASSTEEG